MAVVGFLGVVVVVVRVAAVIEIKTQSRTVIHTTAVVDIAGVQARAAIQHGRRSVDLGRYQFRLHGHRRRHGSAPPGRFVGDVTFGNGIIVPRMPCCSRSGRRSRVGSACHV